jgi:hypothetical protein
VLLKIHLEEGSHPSLCEAAHSRWPTRSSICVARRSCSSFSFSFHITRSQPAVSVCHRTSGPGRLCVAAWPWQLRIGPSMQAPSTQQLPAPTRHHAAPPPALTAASARSAACCIFLAAISALSASVGGRVAGPLAAARASSATSWQPACFSTIFRPAEHA